jgi:glycosyltransferase involved in cell wall biosynthesis
MPSPYVQDLFSALAADDRVELTVWYMEQVAPDTYWGEQQMPGYAQVLPGKWYGFSGARIHWNAGIQRLIADSDADLFVIVGYIGLTNQVAMRTLNKLRRPWVFWGEVPGLHRRGWMGTQMRSILQRPLRNAAGVAGVGSHAVAAYRELLESYNSRCVFRNIPYHCSLHEFTAAAQGRGPSSDVRILYCGQLIARKGVDLLCRAFERLVDEHCNVRLTLAGEGPLKAELQASLSERAKARVCFAGFQPVSSLPQLFADADIFVLPSRHDGWGVVVNQALAAGLPVVATRAVGAALDLLTDLSDGCVIEPDSENALYESLKWISSDRARITEMSKRAYARSREITLDRGVDDWCDFFDRVMTSHS